MTNDPSHPPGGFDPGRDGAGASDVTPPAEPGRSAARRPLESGPPGTPEDAGSVAHAEALRSSFLIVRVLLAALVVYFFCSGIFTVSSQERAILLRFGEPVRRAGQVELGPGLHWAFPYPIDEVIKMPVARLQTVRSTVGWYAVTSAQEAEGIVSDAGNSLLRFEGYAITGDGNIIHACALVWYRVTELLKFFLNHRDAAAQMTNIVDNAPRLCRRTPPRDDASGPDVTGFASRCPPRQ
jgi:membrane protease subunit HflK